MLQRLDRIVQAPFREHTNRRANCQDRLPVSSEKRRHKVTLKLSHTASIQFFEVHYKTLLASKPVIIETTRNKLTTIANDTKIFCVLKFDLWHLNQFI